MFQNSIEISLRNKIEGESLNTRTENIYYRFADSFILFQFVEEKRIFFPNRFPIMFHESVCFIAPDILLNKVSHVLFES